MRFVKGPSRLGNVFIAIGLVLLLYIPISWGWTEFQGWQLRNQLEDEGTPPETSAPLVQLPAWLATPVPTTTEVPIAGASSPATEPATAGDLTPLPAEPGPALAVEPRLWPFAPHTGTPLPADTPPTAPTAEVTATLPPTDTPVPTPTPVPAGPPARLVFPDLHIDGRVTPMGWETIKKADGTSDLEWQVPNDTAGWAITSAPLGVPGNTVLSAHNNIYGMLFRPISLAWPENRKQEIDPATYSTDILNGRKIDVYDAHGKLFQYQVTGFYRLHDSGVPLEQQAANAGYMQPTSDPELTLITCWPPWSNTYRLIVRAKLVAQG